MSSGTNRMKKSTSTSSLDAPEKLRPKDLSIEEKKKWAQKPLYLMRYE